MELGWKYMKISFNDICFIILHKCFSNTPPIYSVDPGLASPGVGSTLRLDPDVVHVMFHPLKNSVTPICYMWHVAHSYGSYGSCGDTHFFVLVDGGFNHVTPVEISLGTLLNPPWFFPTTPSRILISTQEQLWKLEWEPNLDSKRM